MFQNATYLTVLYLYPTIWGFVSQFVLLSHYKGSCVGSEGLHSTRGWKFQLLLLWNKMVNSSNGPAAKLPTWSVFVWSNLITFDLVYLSFIKLWVWSSLIEDDQIWSSLIVDQVWWSLIQFDLLWWRLIKSDHDWSSLIKIDQVWSRCIKYNQDWSSMIKIDQVWSSMIKYD